jgi:hypothetical protein
VCVCVYVRVHVCACVCVSVCGEYRSGGGRKPTEPLFEALRDVKALVNVRQTPQRRLSKVERSDVGIHAQHAALKPVARVEEARERSSGREPLTRTQ